MNDAVTWGSDVMADAMRALGLPYVSLNPGSSYRGLHDSLVNHAGNEMEMICCPHEKIAVGVAHGYAKATGEPMGVILHTQRLDSTARTIASRLASGTTMLDLGFNDLGLSAWSEDYAALLETDEQVTADTVVALPMLLEQCRKLVATDSAEREEERRFHARVLATLHEGVRESWATAAAGHAETSPVAPAWLAAEVWEVVRDHDWVLTAGTAGEWARRLWDFDAPHRHPGRSIGTATQIGISLGVALAHRGTGRLVVDLQPDGDLMFDAGALWVASYYRLPMLAVMYNNRAYYNDWEHQERLARQRGTPLERAHIGLEIDRPAPDFATLARSFDWYAEGPIDDPAQVRAAVRRAADQVLTTGLPALVDVVCQPR